MMSFKQLGFKIVFLVVVVFIALINSGTAVRAQGVNDFVIEEFTAEYALTNKDPQGLLEITETISVNYSGQNRGILRAIPATYSGKKLNIVIKKIERDQKTEPYILYAENNNIVIKIGDPNTYLTGNHTYSISYTLENVVRFYENHDELYWDVNGNDWLQTFNNVDAVVRTDALTSTAYEPICFTGLIGTKEQSCVVEKASLSTTYSMTRPLQAGETLTIVQGFEKGYFSSEAWTERNWGIIVASPLFLMQSLVVTSAYSRWNKYGKDYKDRKAIAPYFERPRGLSVMQSSYVLHNSMQAKYVSASIIDLAIRGYIKIVEIGEGRKTRHELVYVMDSDDYLTEDEKKLLNDIFTTNKTGETVSLEKSKNKLYKSIPEITKILDDTSAASGYYELSPKNAFKKLAPHLLSAAVLFVVGILFANFTQGISVLISIFMIVGVVGFSALMTKRSVKGNALVDHMKGLKMYLERSEKDRLKMQDAVAAPLSRNVHQPRRDRVFFERLLPYAVALGVEKSWADAFADIYSQPPEWYQGSWSTFTTLALVNSVSGATTAVNMSFSAPSSSGGSGFSSGGGFSGGGGGGGGGGGW
jgi:uncharacterized membrane protein YgcG